jgi:hypothetical protein
MSTGYKVIGEVALYAASTRLRRPTSRPQDIGLTEALEGVQVPVGVDSFTAGRGVIEAMEDCRDEGDGAAQRFDIAILSVQVFASGKSRTRVRKHVAGLHGRRSLLRVSFRRVG